MQFIFHCALSCSLPSRGKGATAPLRAIFAGRVKGEPEHGRVSGRHRYGQHARLQVREPRGCHPERFRPDGGLYVPGIPVVEPDTFDRGPADLPAASVRGALAVHRNVGRRPERPEAAAGRVVRRVRPPGRRAAGKDAGYARPRAVSRPHDVADVGSSSPSPSPTTSCAGGTATQRARGDDGRHRPGRRTAIGRDRVRVVLYPTGGFISDTQEPQMTTIDEPNVHAVGVGGCADGGDDLDAIVAKSSRTSPCVRSGSGRQRQLGPSRVSDGALLGPICAVGPTGSPRGASRSRCRAGRSVTSSPGTWPDVRG